MTRPCALALAALLGVSACAAAQPPPPPPGRDGRRRAATTASSSLAGRSRQRPARQRHPRQHPRGGRQSARRRHARARRRLRIHRPRGQRPDRFGGAGQRGGIAARRARGAVDRPATRLSRAATDAARPRTRPPRDGSRVAATGRIGYRPATHDRRHSDTARRRANTLDLTPDPSFAARQRMVSARPGGDRAAVAAVLDAGLARHPAALPRLHARPVLADPVHRRHGRLDGRRLRLLFRMDLREYLPFLALSLVLWGYLGSLVTEGCMAFTHGRGHDPLGAHAVSRSMRRAS